MMLNFLINYFVHKYWKPDGNLAKSEKEAALQLLLIVASGEHQTFSVKLLV